MTQLLKQWAGFNVNEKVEPKNQCVVITGAASGIGKECLRWFARAGYYCVGIDTKFGDHDEFKKSLSMGSTEWNFCLEACDVANYQEFHRIIEKYENKFGYIHCLVNNAGEKYLGQVDTQDPSEWTRMIEVNVMGVLNGIRCVLNKMKDNKDGCIINIGDIGGQKHYPNHTVYCATKAALEGISEGVRREVCGHDIKVISVNPGAVDTRQFSRSQDKNIENKDKSWKDSLQYGILQSEDVARSCLFVYEQPKRCLIREIDLAPIEQDM